MVWRCGRVGTTLAHKYAYQQWGPYYCPAVESVSSSSSAIHIISSGICEGLNYKSLLSAIFLLAIQATEQLEVFVAFWMGHF